MGHGADHLRVRGMAERSGEVSGGVRSIVGHPSEGGGWQGIRDGGRKVAAHKPDDVIVEWAGRVKQIRREGSGRMANDVNVVFISLDHKEDNERGAGGLSGYCVLANCLIGGRCPTNDTLQGRVVRHGHSPSRCIREVVRNTSGGHSWGSVLSFGSVLNKRRGLENELALNGFRTNYSGTISLSAVRLRKL